MMLNLLFIMLTWTIAKAQRNSFLSPIFLDMTMSVNLLFQIKELTDKVSPLVEAMERNKSDSHSQFYSDLPTVIDKKTSCVSVPIRGVIQGIIIRIYFCFSLLHV